MQDKDLESKSTASILTLTGPGYAEEMVQVDWMRLRLGSLRKHNFTSSKLLEVLTPASKQAPSVNMHRWVSWKPWTVPGSHRWSTQNKGQNMWWGLDVPGLRIKYSNFNWHTKGGKGLWDNNTKLLYSVHKFIPFLNPSIFYTTVSHHFKRLKTKIDRRTEPHVSDENWSNFL